MIIFAADDPLVLNGTYDREGYKPGERARIAKARAHQVDTANGGPMAKRRTSQKPTTTGAKPGRKRWSAERKPVTHRVTTRHADGVSESREVAPAKVPIGEAMRRAVEALGDVQIDETLAPRQLAELADCYEQITREQAAFDAKSEEAKTAKKALESATNLLLEKVRAFTHSAPLPLFDQKQAERDRAEMVTAAETGRETLDVEQLPA